MRTECLNCINNIENEGDAFCSECEPNFALWVNEIITIEEYNKRVSKEND